MSSGDAFVLYVEGPRDRAILEAWAKRLDPTLARSVVRRCVILGGRQPARAERDLAARAELEPEVRGLCILDRDRGEPDRPQGDALDIHTWSRRQIESYLLVPPAIVRAAVRSDPGRELERGVRELLPRGGERETLQSFDAKRWFGRYGPLATRLGRPVDPGRVARCMREEEIPAEPRGLLERVAHRVGLAPPPVEVLRRPLGVGPGCEV